MTFIYKITSLIGLIVMGALACNTIMPNTPETNQVMDAPLEGLSNEQNALFLAGAEEFDENYNSATGLGPIFVATSCAGCHSGDNRGHLSTVLTRFGQTDSTGNQFLDFGGPQLQHRALPGYQPEQIPAGAVSSRFIAPIVAGTGFLENVPESEILALADPYDLDLDGISGVPNWNSLPDFIYPPTSAVSMNGRYLCRFGRKASAFNLLHQATGAFNQDMGITTTLMPKNPINYLQVPQDYMNSDPEVSDASLGALVFYLQVLQAPLRRNSGNAEVLKGEALFKTIGCEKCHRETLKTGYSNISVLSEKTFHPYTDLLLHDMGQGLNDGYTEGTALPSEWKTQPLWGLGLAANAQGGQMFLLHDGRAHSINEAILFHGGESQTSRDNYNKLSESDKSAIIAFLESL